MRNGWASIALEIQAASALTRLRASSTALASACSRASFNCCFFSIRITGVIDETKGQMSVFYSGKVNVYDGVPAEKAQALFQLAASPLEFSQEDSFDDNSRLHREEISIFREDNSVKGGSASRKASVQRYLEKQKDRFKSKKKAGGPASGSLDVNLSHQFSNQNQKEHSRRSYTCLPPIRMPNTPNRSS